MKSARELAEYINADLYSNDDNERIETAILADRAEMRRDTVRRVIGLLCRRAYLDDDIWYQADVIREFTDEISLDAMLAEREGGEK